MNDKDRNLADDAVANGSDLMHDHALSRLKSRRDFKTHLFTYILLTLAAWVIWLVIAINSHYWRPWPAFMTLGWGIGVAFNAWHVYFRHPITEADVGREIERLKAAS